MVVAGTGVTGTTLSTTVVESNDESTASVESSDEGSCDKLRVIVVVVVLWNPELDEEPEVTASAALTTVPD